LSTKLKIARSPVGAVVGADVVGVGGAASSPLVALLLLA
jgi:hypothetical protein